MTWNAEYWNIVRSYYWDPHRIGCRRIVELCEDCLKKRPVQGNSEGEVLNKLRRQEEPLNHVFNIALRIMPDALLRELFFLPFGLSDCGPFEFIGRETVDARFGMQNVTQHDAMFRGPSTVFGVELKIDARSTPGEDRADVFIGSLPGLQGC